jgi:glycosyl transferase family 25
LSAGEVGCFLSHRTCWERIAAGESEYGCIFEDDVLLSSRLPEFLADTNWIPRDAEIVKIEDAGIRVWLDPALIKSADGFRLGRLRSANYRAGGYILSRESAKRLLAATAQFAIPVDLVLFDHSRGFATKMVIYQVVPALCVQKKGRTIDDADTTIDERGRFEREGSLARQARRYLQEGWKLWHRLRGRRRMSVGFDAS